MSTLVERPNVDELSEVECCDACEKATEALFFCKACDCTFCTYCWPTQIAHRRKKNGVSKGQEKMHEKVDMKIVKLTRSAFSVFTDNMTLESRLSEDEDAAWFGINRASLEENRLYLRDYGRYAYLISSSQRFTSKIKAISAFDSSTSAQIPSIVSFVGHTGAGKSTLIRLLVQLNATAGNGEARYPVVGVPGKDVPTSEDVHLYADPATFATNTPIFYADCEGLDGGEREPLATTVRKNGRLDDTTGLTRPILITPPQSHCSETELSWATSPERRTRRFAVSEFFPRLLFTFSDVVVFVHRNARAVENVLEKLIVWAAAALETSCNQPILPFAIIALNASENVDPKLWDVDEATSALLESMSDTIDQNIAFAKFAKFWRNRDREIRTVEELLLCYYSAVKVVRLPTDANLNIVHQQTERLYEEIKAGCKAAQNRKSSLRMLLDAENMQEYLQFAFDHYSHSLDVPFDFIQASFLHSPIPSNFGRSILKLAISSIKSQGRLDSKSIFNKISNLVGSCIMLDAVRNNVLGIASHIFPQYLDHLDAALLDFRNHHWPCEYVMRGQIPAHLQNHLGTLQFHQNMRVSAVLYRCVNVRSGHASKGHQLGDGRIFARGGYISKISYSESRDDFHASVYFRLEQLLKKLGSYGLVGESQRATAVRLHRENLVQFFEESEDTENAIDKGNHEVCWCCMFSTPEHVLSCGHVICTPCLRDYGRVKSKTEVQIHECPFESYGRCHPRTVYIKPKFAGMRVLVLESGDIAGIIQLEILRLLEAEMLGRIPIQFFFDSIIGEGTGSVVALGLINSEWTIDECLGVYLATCSQALGEKNHRKFPRIKHPTCQYRSSVLEQSLQEYFPEDEPLFGSSRMNNRFGTYTTVAIPSSTQGGKPLAFTNHNQRYSKATPYTLSRTEDAKDGIRVWEAIRASMANAHHFQPFKLRNKRTVCYDEYGNSSHAITVAMTEFQQLPNSTPSDSPDFALSLGGLWSNSEHEANHKEFDKWSMISTPKKQQLATGLSYSQQCAASWVEYTQSQPEHTSLDKFVRINLKIPMVDVTEREKLSLKRALRTLVQQQVDPLFIARLASQLFATFFYFEPYLEIDHKTGRESTIRGKILCRVSDGAPEICEIGKILRTGSRRATEFVFRCDASEAQYFQIPLSTVDRMICDLSFEMPDIKVQGEVNANYKAMLRFVDGQEFSISGFPRVLLGKNQTSRKSEFVLGQI
ncbi:hypothetical protein BGZ60DRAFT_397086 [Tricladium varicosporioides]|nr:hypothetical protein BGZ60DRAFT_397086 [Hymenoscyphus varicosporioides]